MITKKSLDNHFEYRVTEDKTDLLISITPFLGCNLAVKVISGSYDSQITKASSASSGHSGMG